MSELLLPVNYRSEIIEPVVALLRSGESCALVGVGSCGKSNIARHLARADVRLHYFQSHAPHALLAYVNCKPLAHHPPEDLYLHALDQLTRAVEEMGGAYTPLQPTLIELWQAAQTNPAGLAKRNLDRACDRLVAVGAETITFILDDCDDLFGKTPPVLFADLRELRDNHKRQVVYLTLTRREPIFLRDDGDTPEFEEFFELISAADHTLPITPYLEADALFMLQRLAARQETAPLLPYNDKRRILDLSGGHAGLIRAIYFAVRRNPGSLETLMAAQLLNNGDVEAECGKIMISLEDDEREALSACVQQAVLQPGVQRRLIKRGLLHQSPYGPPQVFSLVLDAYLRQDQQDNRRNPLLEFIDASRRVKVNGQEIAGFTWPEYEVLKHLYQHRPNPCSATDLIEAMRPAEIGRPSDRGAGNPLGRLSQYVLELRAKLGPVGDLIQHEQTGYRFASS